MVNEEWGGLVIARNEEKYLFKTLSSIENQYIKPKKFIYIDDGSTDSSIEIVKKFSFIDIIELSDKGFSALGNPLLAKSINYGFNRLKNCNLDYVLIIGATTVLPSCYMEKIIQEMNNSKLAITSGYPYNEPYRKDAVLGSGRVIKTKMFLKIGFQYPLLYCWEDFSIVELERLGYDSYIIEDLPFYKQRKTGTNIIKLNRFYGWGLSMSAIGYWTVYAFLRAIKYKKHGIDIMRGFFAPNDRKAPKITRQFFKNKQMKRLVAKVLTRPN